MDTASDSPVSTLVIYSGERRRVTLSRRPLIVGRAADCDVLLLDESVSRHHCRLTPDGPGWRVEDLGSRAGLVVDGQRVAQAMLAGDSWLRLGTVVMQLQCARADEPEVQLSGEPTRDTFLLNELHQAIKTFVQADDLDQVLRTIVDRGLRVAGGERGALFMADGEEQQLELLLARDLEGHDLPLDALLTRSLPLRAAQQGRPVVIADVDAPVGDDSVPASLGRAGCRSVVCVPLPAARGALYVDSARPATSIGTAELAVLAMLAAHACLAIERAVEGRRERDERERLRDENRTLRARVGTTTLLGDSPAMQAVLALARRVAPAAATVCISGETGTGKELLARHLHALSPRAHGPFAVLDCGALPASLVESELFGHERGAFTGAIQASPGRIREAHGGTLFLDEIAELPLGLQPRLLRVLQEREVHPLGGRAQHVDVRVVCATHRDLAALVAAGTFREDLYYRLGLVTITLPALRAREHDALLLARHLLARQQAAGGSAIQGFTRDAERALLTHAWPGNVRELQHRVQRALLLAAAPFITSADLGLTDGAPRVTPDSEAPMLSLPEARLRAAEYFERAYLERLLGETAGSVARAARLAGVSRQALYPLLKRHGLTRGRFAAR